MSDAVQSPFMGAVLKDSKTKCTGDGKSTGSDAGGSNTKTSSY